MSRPIGKRLPRLLPAALLAIGSLLLPEAPAAEAPLPGRRAGGDPDWAASAAYPATGDPRYSRKALGLIQDWIAQSDVRRCFAGTRYVWGSYLNNAIHCQAWCRCVTVLLARGQVEPIELLRVLKSVHDQLAYLRQITRASRVGRGLGRAADRARDLRLVALGKRLRTSGEDGKGQAS